MGEVVEIIGVLGDDDVPHLIRDLVHCFLHFLAESRVVDLGDMVSDDGFQVRFKLLTDPLVAFREADHDRFSVVFYIL